MAGPVCQTHDGVPATFLGTFLTSGDTVAVCDECLVAFTAAILNSLTGVDPSPFLAAVSEQEPVVEADPAAIRRAIEQDEADAAESNGGVPVGGTDDAVSPPTGQTDPTRGTRKSGRIHSGSPVAGTETDLDADGPATPLTSDAPAA